MSMSCIIIRTIEASVWAVAGLGTLATASLPEWVGVLALSVAIGLLIPLVQKM